MMNEIAFVISATCVVGFLFHWLPMLFGEKNTYRFPIPILHIWDITFAHSFVSVPAITFQIWFWSNHLGLF